MTHTTLVLPAIAFVLVAVGIEWWIAHRQGRHRSVAVMLGNGWMALFEQAAGLLVYTGLVGVYAMVQARAPVRWPETHWLTWLWAFGLVDLAFYVYHRFCHGTRIGWLFHAVHHQSPQLEFSAALRNSPFGGALQFVFHLPLALIGIPVGPWLIAKAINPLWQLALHTEVVGRIGWAEGWLNTPSAHRVHHGTQPHYRDRNLGGMFVIWDVLFGTYTPEAEPPDYGTDPPLRSLDPILAQVQPFQEWHDGHQEERTPTPLGTTRPSALLGGAVLFGAGVVTLAATVLGGIPVWAGIPLVLVGGSVTAWGLR